MTQEPSNNELPIEDAFAELLSAYHDGELSAEERAEVEERLADDPAAGQWLRELQTMGNLCQQTGANGPWKDLSSEVLAEATRRREEAKPQVAPPREESYQLEPAGEFGLPFGRSSRGWTWAAVAAAAAIIIGYWDRPNNQATTTVAQNQPSHSQPAPTQPSVGAPSELKITPVARGINQMRQVIPDLRVVRVEMDSKGRDFFEESLKRNGFGFQTAGMENTALPRELNIAQQAGIVEPYQPNSKESSNNQLMFVSAEPPSYSRVVKDLSNKPDIIRVEADPAPAMISTPEAMAARALPTSKKSYVIRIRIVRTPSGKLRIQSKLQERGALPGAEQPLDPLLQSSVAPQDAEPLRQNQGVGERQTAPATTAMTPRTGNVRVPVVFVLNTRP